MVVEVDKDNPKKDIAKLDIEIPAMSARIQREYKNLADLDPSKFENNKLKVKIFSEQEKREIIFKDVVGEEFHHSTELTGDINPNYQTVIGFFAQAIMRELRLFGCYDVLYEKVKIFIKNYLFEKEIDLNDLNIFRNLSEQLSIKTIKESFKKAINDLTIKDKGDTEIRNYIKVSEARPFVVNNKSFFIPKKSVFNRIVGDSDFELVFSEFLEKCDDVVSFAKNYMNKEANALRIEYKNAEGFIATYYPDFFDKIKFDRLKLWCEDVNSRQSRSIYKALYVKQEEWEKYKAKDFKELINLHNSS